MNTSNMGAGAKAILHTVVSLSGNSAIIALLPQILPTAWVAAIFVVFNLCQVLYAFFDPTYAVHLIQTGQMSVPGPVSKTTSNPQQ